MKFRKLSIIVPLFNEEKTIGEILRRLYTVRLPVKKEVIVIDDGSTDRSARIAKKVSDKNPQTLFLRHEANLGKGAAVATGLKFASGDYVIIQDSDLEYNPKDIPRLLSAVSERVQVVYGTRLTRWPILFGQKRTPFLIHFLGNRLLSLFTSLLYGCWLTDMETGYKLFPGKAFKKTPLRSRGFDLEAELTAKLLKNGYKIKEVAIETKPRSYAAGKKIRAFRDGLQAFLAIIKYRVTN